jgi:hypothetical protein
MGCVINTAPRPLYPRERTVSHCIEGWVSPTAGLDGCGTSHTFGTRFPDRLARSNSLHLLNYPNQPLCVRACLFVCQKSNFIPSGMQVG